MAKPSQWLQLSTHICVCEGKPNSPRALTSVWTVKSLRSDGYTGILDSSQNLMSGWTIFHYVQTDATLISSKLLDTNGRLDGNTTSSGRMLLKTD
jgi:hypothetical protein